MSVEFTVNNKVYLATKTSLLIANYSKELRMGVDVGRKGKMEKVVKFVERMKRVQKEARAVLKKMQEEMK